MARTVPPSVTVRIHLRTMQPVTTHTMTRAAVAPTAIPAITGPVSPEPAGTAARDAEIVGDTLTVIVPVTVVVPDVVEVGDAVDVSVAVVLPVPMGLELSDSDCVGDTDDVDVIVGDAEREAGDGVIVGVTLLVCDLDAVRQRVLDVVTVGVSVVVIETDAQCTCPCRQRRRRRRRGGPMAPVFVNRGATSPFVFQQLEIGCVRSASGTASLWCVCVCAREKGDTHVNATNKQCHAPPSTQKNQVLLRSEEAGGGNMYIAGGAVMPMGRPRGEVARGEPARGEPARGGGIMGAGMAHGWYMGIGMPPATGITGIGIP